jgi:hypothetical protein
MPDEKPDPIRTLDEFEVKRITGGGISRMIPAVKLFDMLRGRSGHVPCPHCRERVHPKANVCPHCHRDLT